MISLSLTLLAIAIFAGIFFFTSLRREHPTEKLGETDSVREVFQSSVGDFTLCSETIDEPRWLIEIGGVDINVPGMEIPSEQHVARVEPISFQLPELIQHIRSVHSNEIEKCELLGLTRN